MVTSDDFVIGAQVLSYSLRRQSCSFPLLCLVTPNLSPRSLSLLSGSGLTPVLVPPLPAPFPSHVAAWSAVGLTKLRIWSLTAYTRVLYIDADCIALRPLDWLLALPLDFAAAPDIFPPDRFNAGVLLVQPSLQVFASLLSSLPVLPSYDGGDTGFLNAAFPDWFGRAEGRLPFSCNAQRVMEWWTRRQPAYWDSGIGDVQLLHLCSSPKVWQARKGGRLERLWWSLHDDWRREEEEEERKEGEETAALPLVDLTACQLPVSAYTPTPLSFPSSLLSVSFRSSLGKRPLRFNVWSQHDDRWLSTLEQRYDRQAQALNAAVSSSPLSAPSIPHIIHQIWLGSAVPSSFSPLQQAWQRLHPHWRYELHTSLSGFPHSAPPSSPVHHRLLSLMAGASNYAQQADILRLDLLLAVGGLYADLDFQPFLPFDSLHGLPAVRLYCGMANTGTVELGNAIIAAAPGHPLVLAALQSLEVATDADTARSIIERTGPGHWTRCVMQWMEERGGERAEEDGVLVLPPSFLFPLPNSLRSLQVEEERLMFRRAESLAMHHWACSWQKDSAKVKEESKDGAAALPAATGSDTVSAAAALLLPDALLNRISQFLSLSLSWNHSVYWKRSASSAAATPPPSGCSACSRSLSTCHRLSCSAVARSSAVTALPRCKQHSTSSCCSRARLAFASFTLSAASRPSPQSPPPLQLPPLIPAPPPPISRSLTIQPMLRAANCSC